MNGLIKCFTILGALFIMLFGVALLAGSIYIVIEDDVFLGNTSIKWITFGILFGVSLVVIPVSASAMFGICRGRPKMICCFQIFVIVFIVLFIGIGVFFVIADDIVFDGGCSNSSN